MSARQVVNFEKTRSRRKKVRLFNLIRLVGGILLVIVLIETGRSVIGNLILRPYAAKWGTIEKGVWIEALFVRDETLIMAQAPGKLRMIVTSGCRVPRDELVAEVVSSDGASTEALSEKESQVGKPASADLAPMNPRLIKAPEPGYFIFQYDGWEEKLGLHNGLQLGKEDFERNYRLQSAGTMVQTGEIIGKIINPFQQWIAIQVTSRETGIPKEGATWWMKTPEGLSPIIYRKRFPLPNTSQQIFLFEDRCLNPASFGKRFTKIYVVYRKVFGICIPKHALFNGSWDRNSKIRSYYVKVMKGDELKPQTVRVLETDESNVIVDGIGFGTVIITR